ncbi:preprotein translocase subunit SecE [Alkalihalobacillus sp. AL-G]|uniref:preprotein translocase subunit SecE n=1 Tax=Alkalihalobacillus sp. AL-G TaxID=2926399 RepID=UPI00272CFBEE|nr:preprotein translocase subunit SecE [Alkalihalobacillus sp. AL-G]WLD93513.1 preprotein translocase subunit SecE [Alkalihalobacillus sp. AL-G]
MAGIAQKTSKFLSNVVRELKRVSWPKRKELTRYTITVVSTVVFVTLFFALVDQGLSWIIATVFE